MSSNPTQTAWLRRHWHTLVAALFWALLIGGYGGYIWVNGLAPREVAAQLIGVFRNDAGPLLYIAVYLVRPLVFCPAWILTVVGGMVFGPMLGVAYTIVGANSSALLAYAVGRFFGANTALTNVGGLLGRYIRQMRDHSFMTIMIMRFMYLPYDLVDYLAGALRIDWRWFLLATALGSLPGMFSFVLFGASFKGDLATAQMSFNPRVFAVSAVIFVISLAISWYFKRREAAPSESV